MTTKLFVISLWAEDVNACAHFYQDVIGLHMTDQHSDHPHFDLGGIYLVILKGRPIPPQDTIPAHFPIVAFVVDDLDATIDRLRIHHVESPWGIEEDTNSRWVMIRDPAGNLIELTSSRP